MTPSDPPRQTKSFARAVAPTSGPAPGVEPSDALALIVWHGMGQQIPFETIETLIRGLTADHGAAHPIVDTRFVKLGDDTMWRAEFDYTAADGRVQRVHLYEVYWAPLTEGRITIRETLSFLVRAGVTGLWYTFPGVFRRHLFGQWVTFPNSVSTALQLAALLLTLAAMVVLNFGIATATSVTVLTGGASRWPSYPLLGDLTADLLVFELMMGGTLAVLWLAYWMQRPRRKAGRPSTRGRWLKWPLWLLVAGAMSATIAVAGLMVAQFWRHRIGTETMWWQSPRWLVNAVAGSESLSFAIVARIAAIWIVAAAVSYLVRSFVVQYVGDVAIYVASHRLDRFYEARRSIKKESLRVLTAIYQHANYPHHIWAGHSLGSVVAYDTLNRLLNESSVTPGLDVPRRTRALVTFGSPLDKTAFLFRAQSEFSDVREAMAAAAQPLITGYANRPIWINVFASGDPIGGRLDYYDAPNVKPSPDRCGGAIVNLRDDEAWIPIVAHTQYWTNCAFLNALRALIENQTA